MDVIRLTQLGKVHNVMTFEGLITLRAREDIRELTVSENSRPNKEKTFWGNIDSELENSFCQIIKKYKTFIENEIRSECQKRDQ